MLYLQQQGGIAIIAPPRKTVDQALTLLSQFTAEQQEWSVTDLSDTLGFHKSTVSRLLKTLYLHGFVVQSPRTRQYRLGPKILELAKVLSPENSLRHKSRPVLSALAQRTGESAVLGLRRGWTAVCTEVVESGKALRASMRVGMHVPLHTGAMGKSILAHLPSEEQDEYLRRVVLTGVNEETAADPADLRAALVEIRERGFVFTSGELIAGAVGISAPVFDASGHVLASVTLELPEVRYRPEMLPEFAKVVLSTAADLTAEIA